MEQIEKWLTEKQLIKGTVYQFPVDVIELIRSQTCNEPAIFGNDGYYRNNACHYNSLLFSQEFKIDNTENRIIEGIVVCEEDGYIFDHFWNRIVFNEEVFMDYDVANAFSNAESKIIVDVENKIVNKSYYEYCNHSISDINNRLQELLPQIENVIKEYYNNHPEHKERYYSEKEILKQQMRYD